MKTELLCLTFAVAFTGLMWVPYILDRIAVRGLMDAVGYPENPKPQLAWAQRLMKAHANAVENLVIFAALVLVAHAAGVTGTAMATACAVYFWARVVHALAYTFGVPWVRTLAFTVGCFVQAVVALATSGALGAQTSAFPSGGPLPEGRRLPFISNGWS